MKRKIIQLYPLNSSEIGFVLYALCDDGTVWCRGTATNQEWEEIETKAFKGGQ